MVKFLFFIVGHHFPFIGPLAFLVDPAISTGAMSCIYYEQLFVVHA